MKNKETLWNTLFDEGTYPLIYDWIIEGKKYSVSCIFYNEFDEILELANQKDLRLSEITKLFQDFASKKLEALKTEPCFWELEDEEPCETLQIVQKHIIKGNVKVNPNMNFTLNGDDIYSCLTNEEYLFEDVVYQDLFNWFKTQPNWKQKIKDSYTHHKEFEKFLNNL